MKATYNIFFFIFLLLCGCSTKKNTQTSRWYHTTTSYFNVYFNANYYFQEGLSKTEKVINDNFAEVIPIFTFSQPGIEKVAAETWDKVVDKCQKTIIKHSITVKPELPKGRKLTKEEQAFYAQKEFIPYVKDAYLLMGVALTMKQEYDLANVAFDRLVVDCPKEPIAIDAKLWMAIISLKMNDMVKVQSITEQLENEKKLLPRQSLFLKKIIVETEIYKQNYLRAASMLQPIVPQLKNKNEKIRCSYILGQLYEKLQYSGNATAQYNYVIKNTDNYDMKFFAMLQKILLDEKANKNPQKDLDQLLRDDKNTDYLDRIYYVFGKLEQKNKQYDKAIDYYKKATSTRKKNPNILAGAYLNLAEIYEYQQKEYLLAQTYYDSTTRYLPPTDTLYPKIVIKAKNLSKLSVELKTILLQDSLLRIAELPPAARKTWAENLLRAQKESLNENLGTELVGGMWYFYNSTAREQGYKAFKELWGERPLQDNWRFQSFSNTMDFDSNENNLSEEKTVSELDKLLNTLPTTDEAKAACKVSLEASIFRAGEIYMGNMNDYQASIKMFERIIQDFPKSIHSIEVMFNLYRLYGWINEPEKAAFYKNSLLRQYPDHILSKYANDPNFISDTRKDEIEAQKLYNETMDLFHKNQYGQVIINSEKGMVRYESLSIVKNFDLLRALAMGGKNGLNSMLMELQQVATRYPNHEIGINAQERYKLLKSRELFLLEEEKTSKLLPPFVVIDTTSKTDQYSDHNEGYYFAIIVGRDADINQLKFNLLVFHADLNDDILQIENEVVSEDLQIVYVKTFLNKKEANIYYRKAAKNPTIYYDIKTPVYTAITISKTNFDLFLKEKNLSTYMAFFRKYIENQE